MSDDYDFIDHDDTALAPDVVEKIINWLQPTDYLAESGEFRRHLLSQAPGTGLWICETDEYRKWHDSPDHGSLWINGVPGAGKSVTAASIIQHLQVTEPDCPVLFFFFRDIVATNSSPRALIQDWLAQLVPYSPKLQFSLHSRLDTSVVEISPNDLFQLFLDGTSGLRKLYCVGDALDEMTVDNRPFLDHLNTLATHNPSSLKMLVTSRPKQYLQSALRDSSIVHVSLQQKLVDMDIMSYLNHRCDVARNLNAETQKLRHQVVEMVAKRSKGLFLYAKLTMDQVEASLRSETCPDIALLEGTLPVGLEEMYTSMLAKQRREHHVSIHLQVLILGAVTHALRPLRLNELAALVKFAYPDVPAPQGAKALVPACCGPLVEILEDETVQIIHHSLTEFLRGEGRSNDDFDFPIIDTKEAHKQMSINCLGYLQSGPLLRPEEQSGNAPIDVSITYDPPVTGPIVFRIPKKADPFDYREARLLHPLLQYAVENWSHHASLYDGTDDEFVSTFTNFVDPDSLSFRRWLVIEWGSTSKTKESNDGIPTALHVAAYAGLSGVALRLLENEASVSSVSSLDAQSRTPLHWAAAKGRANVASLLIQYGSNPDSDDEKGTKPIHLAARKNFATVVRLLLEAGVEPNSIKTRNDYSDKYLGIFCHLSITKGECAILYASLNGHTETLISMIPFCKEPKALEQLLCEACRFDRTEAALAILDQSDVSPNAMYRGATALFLACGNADVKCVQALVQRGADVNAMSEWKPRRKQSSHPSRRNDDEACSPMAPLHHLILIWSAKSNAACQTIFQILLEAKVDIEQLDGLGNSPLLLAAGASITDPTDGMGKTKTEPYLPALSALIAAGADITKTSRGDGPLHLLLRNPSCSLEAVQLLVEHGSDVNQVAAEGACPLQCITEVDGYEDRKMASANAIVEFLLDRGADPHALMGSGKTSAIGRTVIEVAMHLWVDVFRTMLSRCTDDVIKNECWFGFSYYNAKSLPAYLDMLLAAGLDINTRHPKNGETRYLRSLEGPWESLRILKEYGARPDAVDRAGNGAMHIIARRPDALAYSYEPRTKLGRLQKLMDEEGLDPKRTNDNGDTLLHIMASCFEATERRDQTDLVRWLVGLGIPADAVNKQGHTAQQILMARTRDITCLSEFAKAISDPTKETENSWIEVTNKDGLNPLHMAAMRCEREVISLLSAGAKLASLTGHGQNVLHLACRARQLNVVGQIIHRAATESESFLGELMNQKDEFGRAPLHYACASGEPESVALLIRNGADVKVLDKSGHSVLHACAEIREEQAMWDASWQPKQPWFLSQATEHDSFRPVPEKNSTTSLYDDPFRYIHTVGSGWYINTVRPYQHPGYDPIARRGRSSFPSVGTMVKMLLRSGADPSVVNHEGFTALDHALRVNCVEVVEAIASDEDVFAQSMKHRKAVKSQIKKEYPAEGDCNPELEAETAQQYRHWIKTRMLLLRPRSAMPMLGEAKATLDEILKSPGAYLDLLTCEDVVRIANNGFHACSEFDLRYYDLVRELLRGPDYLQIVERIPDLILHYSSAAVLEQKVKTHEKQSGSQSSYDDIANAHSLMGWTPLQLACQHWQPNMLMLKLLVETHHVDVNSRCTTPSALKSTSGFGGTALHIVASSDSWWHLDALGYLLAHGADINAQDETGQTPLHIAARGPWYLFHNEDDRGYWGPPVNHDGDTTSPKSGSWRLDAVRLLLKHGADANMLDNKGHSALHKIWKSPDIARELLQGGGDWTLGSRNPIFHAIYEQNVESVEALLDHGVSVDAVDESGSPRDIWFRAPKMPRKLYALFCASRAEKTNTYAAGSAPLVRCLVQRGADLYLPLNEDETLIHFIFENAESWIIDTLLKEPCLSKIDFNARDQRGRTVLTTACRWKGMYRYATEWDQNAALRILNSASDSADPLQCDNDGKYPIHHMLENCEYPDEAILTFINHPKVAPTLLMPDKTGHTPFHYALRHLRPVVVEALVAKGANLLDPDLEGRVALHHIARQCLLSDRQDPDRDADEAFGLWAPGRSHPKEYFDQCLKLWDRYIELAGGKAFINVQDGRGNTPLMAYLDSANKEPRSWPKAVSKSMDGEGGEEGSGSDSDSDSQRKRVCHLEFLDRLFPRDSGVDLGCRNHEGETVLHVIAGRKAQRHDCWEGHDVAVFEAFVIKGLDPLRQDERGRSALDVADACGKGGIVDLFKRKS